MTDIPQFESIFPASDEAARDPGQPWPRGVGLAIGAVASLGLWAGLAHLALRLIG